MKAPRDARFVVSNVQAPMSAARLNTTVLRVAARSRVATGMTMGRTKGLLLTLGGVMIVIVIHAQGLQLAITDEQLHQGRAMPRHRQPGGSSAM